MKTYTYKGVDPSAAGDVALIHGESYQLDDSDPHVKSLAAQKLLEEVNGVNAEPEKEKSEKKTQKKIIHNS